MFVCLKFAFAKFLGYASIGPCASIAGNRIGVSAFFFVVALFDHSTFVAWDETLYSTVGTQFIPSKSRVTLATEKCVLLAPHWEIFFVFASLINIFISATNPKLANSIRNRRKQVMGELAVAMAGGGGSGGGSGVASAEGR